jgi:integrase
MTLPALANAPSPEPDFVGSFAAWLAARGCVGETYAKSARRFFARWPDPHDWADQPLEGRLRLDRNLRVVLNWLILTHELHPGYDWLVATTPYTCWQEFPTTQHWADVERFLATATNLGYAERTRTTAACRVLMRLLIQTGGPLSAITESDLAGLEAAARERTDWRGCSAALHASRVVLYHLGVLERSPDDPPVPGPLEWRFAASPAGLRSGFLGYLERLAGFVSSERVRTVARHLGAFGEHLGRSAPEMTSFAELDRRTHIEPFLNAVAAARRKDNDEPVSISERRQRISVVSRFLADIAEWGWSDAPQRRLIFVRDAPREPRPLPRYIPLDADRRLHDALETSPNRLLADGLLVVRATGIRIGELLTLELDCVHEVSGLGSWLKVPLGKFDTERMVPLDDETVTVIDRLVAARGPQRALRHPRNAKMVDFLMVHYGRRISQHAMRSELRQAAAEAGLDGATPHQLRHTYATALVNSGVPLQHLMVLLGHQSAEMSLRYGRLFDSTVRESYERALSLAKAHLGPILPQGIPVELNTDWRSSPLIKTRLAGGYCLRTVAQGPCAYANICEHCPSLRNDTGFIAVLDAQRADTEALAADAEARSWSEETARHHRLLERLDLLLSRAQAG